MLFPTNPNARPELWESFAHKVKAGTVSFVVHRGKKLADQDRQSPLSEGLEQVVNVFRSSGVIRFGSSRGHAIGPFLAFDVGDGTARLTEYAFDSGLQSNTEEAVQEGLQSVAMSIFFEQREITEILLPLSLPTWRSEEWIAKTMGEATALQRKQLG